jgi:hypothetical protein
MTKKIIIPIIGLAILIVCFIGWRAGTYSNGLPYPNLPDPNGPDACLQSIANEAYVMKDSWNANLQSLIQQPKAPSGKVDEAFEGLRTYHCWLDYLCQAVLYSGNADPVKMKKDESDNISIGYYLNTLPGCIDPSKVVIPGTKLKYMPYCNVPTNANTPEADAHAHYMQCESIVQMQFGDTTDADKYYGGDEPGKLPASMKETLKNQSGAFIGLENTLKSNAADQKSRVLQEKLSDIVTKMHGMETHMDILNGYMEQFDQRLPCFIGQCDM